MKTYVLDTSVSLAWYLDESFSEPAREWQERFLEDEIRFIAPEIHLLEFANVLRTLVLRKDLERELAMEIYSLHLSAGIRLLPVPPEPLLETALDFGATTYDAAFIRLALDHGAPLLTAERTTTPWVVKLGELARPVRT